MIFFCQQITCLSKDFHSPNADEIELVNPAAAEHIIIDLLYAFFLSRSLSLFLDFGNEIWFHQTFVIGFLVF